MKLKKMPSLKPHSRYIIFRAHSQNPLLYSNVSNAVWNSLENWLGEQDLAEADVRIIRNLWNPKAQTGFIRCSHKFLDLVKTGIALIHQIGDERVVFQTLRVSGTIRSGKRKAEL